jgi:hypothetical protein
VDSRLIVYFELVLSLLASKKKDQYDGFVDFLANYGGSLFLDRRQGETEDPYTSGPVVLLQSIKL